MHQQTRTSESAQANQEIDLIDYWYILKNRTKSILAIVVFVSVLAVVVSLLLPKTYQAESVILPISSSSTRDYLSTLKEQQGGLGALLGSLATGIAPQNTITFLALLQSRTLTERIIEREALMPVLFPSQWDHRKNNWKSDDPKQIPLLEDARALMNGHMAFIQTKKFPTITITGTFQDPKLAARIVNAYVEELQAFLNTNALTVAKRNRIFIEEQLNQNKSELLTAGKNLSEFYQKYRVSNTESKISIPLDKLGKPQNPAPAAGESTPDQTTRQSSAGVTTQIQEIPQRVYYEYLTQQNEVLKSVSHLLSTQYELAKIDEAKEGLAFQVIDEAVPPVRRAFPKRARICMIAFFSSLFFGCLYALFAEYIERARRQGSPRNT